MKYTLIIDGHNFLFRSLYVLPQKKGVKILSDKESKDLFVSKLEQNINAVLRDMEPIVDRCVITLDSQSWRKSILSDVDYKGTRHQEETIDWDGFAECMHNFVSGLDKYNITVSKTKQAEADDLIFYWSHLLNNKGIPVIIYSSDKDMLQIVGVTDKKTDTLLYSDVTKKIYVPVGFEKIAKQDNVSIYESFAAGASYEVYDRFAHLKSLINKRKLEMIEVDSEHFRFVKVLTGDKSDNISSVYSYEKNGRTFNVTEAKAEKILEDFTSKVGALNSEYLYVDDTIGVLAESCSNVLKLEGENKNVADNIRRNVKYMMLSLNVIPTDVADNMLTDIRELAKRMKRVNFTPAHTAPESIVKKTSGIFKGVDTSDMSFIKPDKNTLF